MKQKKSMKTIILVCNIQHLFSIIFIYLYNDILNMSI